MSQSVAVSPGAVSGSLSRKQRPYADLFLISFLILFFELACIRWFGSTVIFLTFFTNIVLMACFLGMSVGCLTAGSKWNYIRGVVPLTAFGMVTAWGLFWVYNHLSGMTIDVGDQKSPQLIYFGTEYRPKDPKQFIIPIQVVAGFFFVVISLMFVGLGQVMGRAFDAIPNRVAAYTTNVLGSLVGIVIFGLMSYLQVNPHLWFSLCLLIILYFSRPWTMLQIFCLVVGLLVVAASAYGVSEDGKVWWSPYYKIRYKAETGEIDTNNIAHQQMLKISEAGPAYALPHLLVRDALGAEARFKDVMIIGAGSGNDVQAALQYGAEDIDAVEIDPVIQSIGMWNHPDKPYHSLKVHRRQTDGRRYVHQTDKKYDLIVYALVDSLVLHSGYSSLRLESFLFTQEALADIKSKLKPGGVFVMYNYYRQGWVVGRLQKMSQQIFGSDPVVISMPYQAMISPADNQANHITFVMIGNGPDNPIVQGVRSKFEKEKRFWLNESPRRNAAENMFGPNRPGGDQPELWREIGLAKVDTSGIDLLPSDNWPFLYSRDKVIPQITLWGIGIIAGLSLVILLVFAPVRTARPNGRMFFLGAGFMLLETKGVVHMALLFGSTWVVNSIVFFAILVMILLANLFVLNFKPKKLQVYYALLLGALLVNAVVPMHQFLDLPELQRIVVSCAVIFIPVFFAGVIFATSFRDSTRPDIDMGSNIAGVILGGLSENLSVMFGFQYLLLVAMLFYVASMVLVKKTTSA